jgi:hypothetical protein
MPRRPTGVDLEDAAAPSRRSAATAMAVHAQCRPTRSAIPFLAIHATTHSARAAAGLLEKALCGSCRVRAYAVGGEWEPLWTRWKENRIHRAHAVGGEWEQTQSQIHAMGGK